MPSFHNFSSPNTLPITPQPQQGGVSIVPDAHLGSKHFCASLFQSVPSAVDEDAVKMH